MLLEWTTEVNPVIASDLCSYQYSLFAFLTKNWDRSIHSIITAIVMYPLSFMLTCSPVYVQYMLICIVCFGNDGLSSFIVSHQWTSSWTSSSFEMDLFITGIRTISTFCHINVFSESHCFLFYIIWDNIFTSIRCCNFQLLVAIHACPSIIWNNVITNTLWLPN